MTSPRVGEPMRPASAAGGPARPTSDLARISGRARTDARPGPGPIADRLVRQL